MATVRAKFVCNYKFDEYVTFSPVHSGSPENDSFFKATPGGEIRLHVLNKQALDAFEEGKSYYVDFTPAES